MIELPELRKSARLVHRVSGAGNMQPIWTWMSDVHKRDEAIAKILFEATDKQDWGMIVKLQAQLVRNQLLQRQVDKYPKTFKALGDE
jgi:hypothetical protein